MKTDKLLRVCSYLLIAFSLIGLGAMIYLPLELSNTVTNSCNINGYLNCGTVANSNYSSYLGIHLYVYGWFFFSLTLVLSLTYYFIKKEKIKKPIFYSIFVLSVLGTIAAVYLIYTEVFQIGAICLMCTIAHASIFGLLICSSLIFREKLKRKH